HVAIRTDMHDCTGAMFEWWFRFRPMTREYKWWHPIDHVSSDWREGEPGTHLGSIHLVEEAFTNDPAIKLAIQFRDPAEVFDSAQIAAASAAGHVSAIIVGHGGSGHEPPRAPDGTVMGGRMVHLARDTEWGMVLRTHFFLGQDLITLGMPPAKIAEIFPDCHAPNLLQHGYDEFTWLSRFLPALYRAENRDTVPVIRPW
ncbi:MAG: hypothetical protein ABIR77_04810, partial [Sphingomicrobium sp.]